MTNGINNNNERVDVTILKEISEKTSSVLTSIGYHNERLTKIEEAILQLASTNERVRAIDGTIRDLKTRGDTFEIEVWENFKKTRENTAACLEHRSATNQHFGSHDRRIEKVEEWKDIVSPSIQGNTKIRGWVEKGIYAVAIFLILGVLGSVFIYTQPNVVMQKLINIEKQIDNLHPQFSFDPEE